MLPLVFALFCHFSPIASRARPKSKLYLPLHLFLLSRSCFCPFSIFSLFHVHPAQKSARIFYTLTMRQKRYILQNVHYFPANPSFKRNRLLPSLAQKSSKAVIFKECFAMSDEAPDFFSTLVTSRGREIKPLVKKGRIAPPEIRRRSVYCRGVAPFDKARGSLSKKRKKADPLALCEGVGFIICRKAYQSVEICFHPPLI